MNLKSVSVWGDGGVPSHYPHQTRKSIESALVLGVHGLNIYVRKCRSGELVLLRDETIDPLSFGLVHNGFVKYKSLEELRAIDFAGEQILTLEDAIRIVNGEVVLNIVLCSEDGLNDVFEVLNWAISELKIPTPMLMFSSHDCHHIKRFSAKMPRISTGVLMSGIPLNYLEGIAELQVMNVFLDIKSAKVCMLRDAEFRSIRVFLIGNASKQEVSLLNDLGLSGIVTPAPQMFIANEDMKSSSVAA